MKLNKKKILLLLIILTVAIETITLASAYTGTGFSHNIPISAYEDSSISDILNKYEDTNCIGEKTGICTEVVDGDTIYLDNGDKIRLVGVNTPEKGVEGADTSKYFVEKLCLIREVSIDIDDSKSHDKYGRTLAVVIVDGKNLNEMLLKEGLAEIMYIPPSQFNPNNWAGDNTHSSDYSNSQKNTNTNSEDTGEYIGNVNSMKFHLPTCSALDRMSENNKVSFSSRQSAIDQGYSPCQLCNP